MVQRSLADPEAQAAWAALIEDEKLFIDLQRSPLWFGEEKVMFSEQAEATLYCSTRSRQRLTATRCDSPGPLHGSRRSAAVQCQSAAGAIRVHSVWRACGDRTLGVVGHVLLTYQN